MLIIKNEGTSKKRYYPTPGTKQAVCYAVHDIGVQESKFGPKHQLIIQWELDELIKEGDFKGKRFVQSKKYTCSLHEKSNLRKDLEAWRSKRFTEKDMEGFDIEKVIGKGCLLAISKEEKEDKTYINITGVTPLMDGMVPMVAENDKAAPQWIVDLQRKGGLQVEDVTLTTKNYTPEKAIKDVDKLPVGDAKKLKKEVEDIMETPFEDVSEDFDNGLQ